MSKGIESNVICLHNLEAETNFMQVLRECKLGTSQQETLDIISDVTPAYITAVYNKYAWLAGRYEERTINHYDKVVLKDGVLESALALYYTRQHLKPRVSVQWGYEVFWNGKYVIYSVSIRNAIEAYLSTLGINKPNIEQSIRNHDEAAEYCPVKAYYAMIEPLTKLESVQEGDPLYEYLRVFEEEGRFVFEECDSMELVFQKIRIWGTYAVAQVLDPHHVNDIALGVVGRKQGTGKTLFIEGLMRWGHDLELVADARYGTSQDAQRRQKSNAFLHDDELGERQKIGKALEDYKQTLSAKRVKYTEKYESQELPYLRLCSFSFSGNTVAFLKEDSRRDYVIKFAETDNYNAKRIYAHVHDRNLNNRLWAYFLYLYRYRFEEIIQEYHSIKNAVRDSNEQYKDTSFSLGLLETHFTEARDIEYDRWFAFQLSDIVEFLDRRIIGGRKVEEKQVKEAIKELGWKKCTPLNERAWNTDRSNNSAIAKDKFRAYRLCVSKEAEESRGPVLLPEPEF